MPTDRQPPKFVNDVMTVDLIALLPEDRVSRARDLLLSVGIHALPVMEGNDVLGIVTSTDLIDDWPEDDLVSAIMTPVPLSIHLDASVREAADLMIDSRIHHLLVKDEREVIGIISSLDLLDAVT
jgi:CBS domain-containing protein